MGSLFFNTSVILITTQMRPILRMPLAPNSEEGQNLLEKTDYLRHTTEEQYQTSTSLRSTNESFSLFSVSIIPIISGFSILLFKLLLFSFRED